MKFRLAKCCYCVSLRSGCILVAFSDICMELVRLDYDNHDILTIISHVVEIAHFMGCLMLFLGTVIEASPLVFIYLATDSLKLLFVISSGYVWLFCKRNSFISLSVICVQTVLGFYFWLIAYSFFRLCRENVSDA